MEPTKHHRASHISHHGAYALRNWVILACSVDAADKHLLPATFKAMDQHSHNGPSGLAAMAFAQNFAFAVAMPIWASMLRYKSGLSLMIVGSMSWGLLTMMVACTTDLTMQIILRFFIGAALASMNPIGQAILCDLTPEDERGRVFGLVQGSAGALSMLVACAATAVSSEVIFEIDGWRWAYICMGLLSVMTSVSLNSINITLPHDAARPLDSQTSWLQEQLHVCKRVAAKPSFLLMVIQGVLGCIPWNASVFLVYYFQISGISDHQVAKIMLVGGVGAVVGAVAGGTLGDLVGNRRMFPNHGRLVVAQISVALGTLTFLWFVYSPTLYHSVRTTAVLAAVFHFMSSWCQPAALRPMCGELFRIPQQRAQILALWIATEGIISSMIGAPIVGMLSERFGFHPGDQVHISPSDVVGDGADSRNANALRMALVMVCTIPWVLCFFAWFPLHCTYPSDRRAGQREFEEEVLGNDASDCEEKPILMGNPYVDPEIADVPETDLGPRARSSNADSSSPSKPG